MVRHRFPLTEQASSPPSSPKTDSHAGGRRPETHERKVTVHPGAASPSTERPVKVSALMRYDLLVFVT